MAWVIGLYTPAELKQLKAAGYQVYEGNHQLAELLPIEHSGGKFVAGGYYVDCDGVEFVREHLACTVCEGRGRLVMQPSCGGPVKDKDCIEACDNCARYQWVEDDVEASGIAYEEVRCDGVSNHYVVRGPA